jgi:hypothetical protein
MKYYPSVDCRVGEHVRDDQELKMGLKGEQVNRVIKRQIR